LSALGYFSSHGLAGPNPSHPISPLLGLLGGDHNSIASMIHSLLGGHAPLGGTMLHPGGVAGIAGGLPMGTPASGLPIPAIAPPGSGFPIHGFGPNGAVTAPGAGHIDTGYNPAGYQRAIGNTQQAVADWQAHHPYAMAHHHIPHWVAQYLLHAIQNATPHPQAQAPAAPPVPTNQAQ